MRNRAGGTIASSYVVITTLVYALVATILLESDNASEEDSNINNAVNTDKPSGLEIVDVSCKSPCPPTSEMCIQMCA